MTVRLIFAAVIFASGTLFGSLLCKEEQREIEALEDLKDFLNHLYLLAEKNVPLGEIFSSFSPDGKSPVKEYLKKASGTPSKKLKEYIKALSFPNIQKAGERFSDALGTLPKAFQLLSVKEMTDTVTAELKAQREEYTSRSRVYRAVSSLASAIVAILLI